MRGSRRAAVELCCTSGIARRAALRDGKVRGAVRGVIRGERVHPGDDVTYVYPRRRKRPVDTSGNLRQEVVCSDCEFPEGPASPTRGAFVFVRTAHHAACSADSARWSSDLRAVRMTPTLLIGK